MKTRLILADDHPVIHQGVSKLQELDETIEIVGNAKNGEELISLYRVLNPDIVLLDDSMPVMNGITAANRLLAMDKWAKIIFYTFSDNKSQIYQTYELGIKGYVLKSSPIGELLRAVNEVRMGDTYFSDDFPETMYKFYRDKRKQTQLKLSYREKQVLKLVAIGHPNKTIAETLELSIRTVEEHRRRIKKKLNLNGAAELIKWAVEHKDQL